MAGCGCCRRDQLLEKHPRRPKGQKRQVGHRVPTRRQEEGPMRHPLAQPRGVGASSEGQAGLREGAGCQGVRWGGSHPSHAPILRHN